MSKYGGFILIYYLFLNIVLFILMGIDKYKAIKHKWRIKESLLFTFALLGGAAGGFCAMSLFHHKTRKVMFYIVFTLGLLFHIGILIKYSYTFFCL